MQIHFSRLGAGLLIALISSSHAVADIIERVTVQPIIVSNNDGSNTAGFFGTGSQESTIKSLINAIWAPAGIDFEWLSPNFWNNSFANVGNVSPRPQADLNTIISQGTAAGVGNTDPLVIDLYFVEVAAGFPQTSINTVNGLAFVGGNGITAHVGDALPTFPGGRGVVAEVIAHELGHNLGLPHINEVGNLMQESGTGTALNANQIATALASPFSRPIAVPEPSCLLLVIGCVGAAATRRRRAQPLNIAA